MASYLKLGGKEGVGSAAGFPGVAADNYVLTAFVRFLSWPVGYTPVVQVLWDTGVLGTEKTLAGIWLAPKDAGTGTTNRANRLAFNWGEDNGGGGYTEGGSQSNIAVPLRLGRVYKLQLIVSESGSISFAVDGVRVATGSMSAPFPANAASYYFVGGPWGSFGAVNLPKRANHMDVIQAMFEVDRTLVNDGGFPQVDADSDPFVDLEVDGSASADSALYLFDEGTGSTAADESGNGHDMGLANDFDWAPAADPTFPSAGVARWDFGSIEGYALRDDDAPTVMAMPVFGPEGPVGDLTAGELRLALMAPTWWEDAEAATQWTGAGTISPDTGEVFSTLRSFLAASASSGNNVATVPTDAGASAQKFWLRGWFYDPGGTTSTRLQRFCWMTGLGAIVCSIGVHHAESSTEYVAFVNGAGTPHVATGVTRAVGWHEFLIYVEVPGVGNSTVRFYASEAGSTAVRTETGVAVSLPGQVGIRVNGQVASDDHGYWDDIHASYERAGTTNARHVGIVEAFGSVVLPLFQPAHVYSFDGVTITDETAGASSMELGSTSYTFRFSSDGGSSWSSPATLNNANLQALDCDGDGLDVLEITVEQTASMDSMGSPATRRIEVQYTPSIVPRIVHHRNQLAGVC